MDDIRQMADRLVGVGGVVGVCLGGSRARGTQRPDSDVDLGLYYRPPLDTAALARLAAELTGAPAGARRPVGTTPRPPDLTRGGPAGHGDARGR